MIKTIIFLGAILKLRFWHLFGAFLCALISTPSASIVVGIDVWRKLYPDGYHYCFFMLDWHIDYKDGLLGNKQQYDLIAIANSCKDPFIITEDATSYSGTMPEIQSAIDDLVIHYHSFASKNALNNKEVCHSPTFLAGLTNLCNKHTLPVYNAECRHFHYLNDTSIVWQDLLDEIQKHIDEINTNNNTLGNHYYNSIRFLLSRIIPGDFTTLNQLCYHLVNAKIAHAIIKNQHKKAIFVCVGAGHFIQHDLVELGYENITSFGSGLDFNSSQHALENALEIKSTFNTAIFPYDSSLKA